MTPPPFPVLLWLWNSVKVASITAIGIVTLSTTCAYAFARMRFPGKATLLKGMLIFQMFPAVLSLVALYALFDRLGQYIPFIGLNTHGGVIFAYLGGIALHVWTIKGYFETIDGSLEEAAARKMFQQRRIHRGHIVRREHPPRACASKPQRPARSNRSHIRYRGSPPSGFPRSRTELPLTVNLIPPSPSSYDRCIRNKHGDKTVSPRLTKAY